MNRPRGLWLLIGAVVAGVVGIGLLWPSTDTAEPSADEVVSTPTRSAEPYLFVGPPDHGGENGEHRWTEDPWRPIAVGFARDFADPGKGVRDWRQRVGRWVSDHLAEQYEHTARYRIPVADLERVVGPRQTGQAVTVVAVYDTGLALSLHLEVFPAAGWKVTQAMPTEAAEMI
jgi:hypothetical protein